MDGNIEVESSPGHGSKFRINLKLEKSKLAQSSLSNKADLRDIKILVVDDNQTNQEILRLQLQNWRTHVVCTDDASQALIIMAQAARINKLFHLAILDMHMPRMNGLQLAREIHTHPDFGQISMMMLTSTHSNANHRERQRAGIPRCINKPIRQKELLEIINDVMLRDLNTPAATDPAPVQNSGLAAAHMLHGNVLLAEDNLVNQEVDKARPES